MVDRPVSLTQTGRAPDRFLQVGSGAHDRVAYVHALRETGGDRRGQGAAGAVRMGRIDARVGEGLVSLFGREHVGHHAAVQVPALDQDRLGTKVQQVVGGLDHARDITDLPADQTLGLGRIGGEQRGARHKPALERRDSILLEQPIAAPLRHHDRIDDHGNRRRERL